MQSNNSDFRGRDYTRSHAAKMETARRQSVRVEKYGQRKGGAK